jgi:hypothetical protein
MAGELYSFYSATILLYDQRRWRQPQAQGMGRYFLKMEG